MCVTSPCMSDQMLPSARSHSCPKANFLLVFEAHLKDDLQRTVLEYWTVFCSFSFSEMLWLKFFICRHFYIQQLNAWLSKASYSNLLYLSVKVDTFSVVWEIRCHSAEVFVSAIWLAAAAAAGKSSASLFPQDVVARCDRAAAWWLRHRRRRLRFLPQSLLGQEACQWGWAGKSRSGGAGGKDVRSGVASRSVWENRLDAWIWNVCSRWHRRSFHVTEMRPKIRPQVRLQVDTATAAPGDPKASVHVLQKILTIKETCFILHDSVCHQAFSSETWTERRTPWSWAVLVSVQQLKLLNICSYSYLCLIISLLSWLNFTDFCRFWSIIERPARRVERHDRRMKTDFSSSVVVMSEPSQDVTASETIIVSFFNFFFKHMTKLLRWSPTFSQFSIQWNAHEYR